jgi:dihydroorotase
MLVDNEATLEKIFSSTPMLIAVHCEDETTVQNNLKNIRQSMVRMFLLRFIILSVVKRLVISSSKAVALAKKTGARLHIFHLSTRNGFVHKQNSIGTKENYCRSLYTPFMVYQ